MEPQHLKLWTMPAYYAGEVWPDYYVFLGQHRDSDSLARSNFVSGLKALGGESETVLVVRESHWAVGWVEWIAIHASDDAALAAADAITAKLEVYPVVDEDHWSDLEYNEAVETWERASISYRVEMCQRAGVSVFAARRDDMPADDSGMLLELLRD